MDFTQLYNAIKRYEEMFIAFNDESALRTDLEKDAIKDSLVKRFEYTLEMSWKSCKRYLIEQGYTEFAIGSPKATIRLAFEAGIIESAERWITYINARHNTAHDYSEEKAENILLVTDDFYKDIILLYTKLSGETWK